MKKKLLWICGGFIIVFIIIISLFVTFDKKVEEDKSLDKGGELQIYDYDNSPEVSFIYYVDNIIIQEYGERPKKLCYISVLKKNGEVYIFDSGTDAIDLDYILERCSSNSPELNYKCKVDVTDLKEHYNDFVLAINNNLIQMDDKDYSLGLETYNVEIIGVGQTQEGLVYKDIYNDNYKNESEPIKDVNEWLIKEFDAPYK